MLLITSEKCHHVPQFVKNKTLALTLAPLTSIISEFTIEVYGQCSKKADIDREYPSNCCFYYTISLLFLAKPLLAVMNL